MNRARPWLAPLLALSANSPFWLGRDTGYASYRTELFGRFPMTGVPPASPRGPSSTGWSRPWSATGMIEDASKIYWDVRPSSHFETLEFRVADVCTTVDEAVMVAGLCRALARTCPTPPSPGAPEPRIRPELLRAANWRAARFGLDGDLIDLRPGEPVPAPRGGRVVARRSSGPALEAPGRVGRGLRLVRQTLGRGNGATRQRGRSRSRAGSRTWSTADHRGDAAAPNDPLSPREWCRE